MLKRFRLNLNVVALADNKLELQAFAEVMTAVIHEVLAVRTGVIEVDYIDSSYQITVIPIAPPEMN